MSEDSNPKCSKRFEIALQTRNFEIDLFWKRSLFFWGFISAAFVTYAALRKIHLELGIVVACFGVVCSFAWTLLNRGSKYWQESWEQKVEKLAKIEGENFFTEEEGVLDKGWWLSARKYSVSKLVIAFSDYLCLLWVFLLGAEIINYFSRGVIAQFKSVGIVVFIVFTAIFVTMIWTCCQKSENI